MPDQFQTGLMLGRVLELAEHTASKVDTIEARQAGLIKRIDTLESASSRQASTPAGKVLLAALAALTGLAANIKAESVGEVVAGLLRGLSH